MDRIAQRAPIIALHKRKTRDANVRLSRVCRLVPKGGP